MSKFVAILGLAAVVSAKLGGSLAADSHVCTAEEKDAAFCEQDYNPVCGNDHHTYSNGCEACTAAAVKSYTNGACAKVHLFSIKKNVILPPKDNSDHVCTAEDKDAAFCEQDYKPVCGNDHHTYSNGCEACIASAVKSYTNGACANQSVVPSPKDNSSHVCTAEDKDAAFCEQDYKPVCGNDHHTYSNGCEACIAADVKSYTNGACTNPKKDVVLLLKDNSSHVCTAEDKDAAFCEQDYKPVCGNDHHTYSNGCEACIASAVKSYTNGAC